MLQGLNVHPYTLFIRASPSSYIIVLNICRFETLSHIVMCQGENKNIFILHIGDPSTMYVFAFKSTHVAYLNLKFQLHQGIQLIGNIHSRNKLIENKVTFDIIS